ncbi:hypothetical protein KIH23_09385 [Flavobacterium sp. CYK-55]|uniref:hypothetical protein n=1 Tax=Flavobacterium sp. CYK-55 TaxID=2835529 RepID=UPI001BCB38F7|nr:hypothetical protein [Flavobacterium sp. CYK-55]MBS7787507.1 hypothetical protein [Flavobacterium sp. CYK-55]
MTKSKIYKILGGLLIFGLIVTIVVYNNLTNRHKAILKTTLLYKTGLVDADWQIEKHRAEYKMISPDFYIDGIYKSMEGPKASNYIRLTEDSSLVWITDFHVRAMDAKTRKYISKDFICHLNVDFNDANYYASLGLESRIGKQYPRMTTLSHGVENFTLPKGFGVPMKGNQWLLATTQSLNHNIPDANYLIKHEVTIGYHKDDQQTKPLMCRAIYIQLPYDKQDPFKEPLNPASNQCVPIETKNHVYTDAQGNNYSGHWLIKPGKNTYKSNVDNQLMIEDSLRLHAAAIHAHPMSRYITLWDVTTQRPVFTSKIQNHKNKIGIDYISSFLSEKGVWLYKNHHYELILDVDNTSGKDQDMMGSMFLFFYDQKLDRLLNQPKSKLSKK